MEQHLTIRREKEVEKIGDIILHEDIYPRLFPFEIQNIEELRKNLHKLKDKNLTIYVFSEDGKDFGVAIGKYFTRLKPKHLIFAKIKFNNKPSLYFARMCGFKVTNKFSDYYFLRLKEAA